MSTAVEIIADAIRSAGADDPSVLAQEALRLARPDLADADTRTQDLASTIALMYADGRIDSAALHELISGLTLIRASIRFASRA